jgi:hypothetical protein
MTVAQNSRAVCYHPFPTNPDESEDSVMQPHLIQSGVTGTFYPAAAHSTPLAPQPGWWNARHANIPNLDLTILSMPECRVLAYAYHVLRISHHAAQRRTG